MVAEIQSTSDRKLTPAAVWSAVAVFALLLTGTIIAAPIALANGHTSFATAIYEAFSYLCHQLPERSFHLAGHQFAVCSRCTGIYAGFAFAALAYPLFRSLKRTETPHIVWLVLAILPLTIDFGITYFGLWQNNHLSRFTTGALLGAVAVLYVIPGLIELTSNIARWFSRSRTNPDR